MQADWNGVEDLIKEWRGPEELNNQHAEWEPDPNWEPLPGMRPFEGDPVGPPKDSLPREIDDNPVLTRECADALRGLRKGTWGQQNAGSCPCGPSVPFPCNHGNQHFHCYPITRHPSWNKWRAHPNYLHNIWYCSNLRNAAARWSWTIYKGGSFEQLSAALQWAIINNHLTYAAAVCIQIFQWGGLNNYNNNINGIWLQKSYIRKRLINDLTISTRSLRAGSSHIFPSFGPWPDIPMTSTTTKLFAAVGMDFSGGFGHPKQDVLIYDGRVGAGLGLLARKLTCGQVPTRFRFPWGQGRGRVNRNPSCNCVTFRELNTLKHAQRAHFMKLGAKCILQTLNANPPKAGNIYTPSADFIMVERALFMLGYEVGVMCNGGQRPCP